MDVTEDDKENEFSSDSDIIECSVEPCASQKMRDPETDEVIEAEVADFVREVVDAVVYVVHQEKVWTRRQKRAITHQVYDVSDTSSTTESTRKKGHGPEMDENASVRRRRRRVTAEQLAERENRMAKRRQASAQKAKEREAMAEEKRRKKEAAQREKERLRREQEQVREQKRAEEQQRKEQRQKENEERKERKRMEEEVKREKRQKEEEERERKRKEEEEKRERKRKEEEAVELKKKRASERFLAFFDKKEKPEKTNKLTTSSPSVLNVLPFFCKQGVMLAPEFRRLPLSNEIHDHLLELPAPEKSYLQTVKPRTIGKVRSKRAKLFQFHDNYRPPYYGTWRKRSTLITGRRPFAKDTKLLDYDFDSDEEWEIPDGDDCDESTASDEEDQETDDSADNDGFFVEHGYLSEGEGEDEEDRLEHHEDPSKRAERLKAVAEEWEHKQKEKTKKFAKPLEVCMYGPYFGEPPEDAPEDVIMGKAVFFNYPDSDDNDDGEPDEGYGGAEGGGKGGDDGGGGGSDKGSNGGGGDSDKGGKDGGSGDDDDDVIVLED